MIVDNPETTSCFDEVKESFLSTQTEEELGLLTPIDIRSTISSWATENTDKKRVQELIFEWLEPYRVHGVCNDLTMEEKHDRLEKTIANAHKELDSILTKRDRDQEEADRKRFNELTTEEQVKYLNDIPVKTRGEDHGKCNMEDYRENMEWILDIALPVSQNKKTRLLNLLDKMGYGYSDDLNGYPYLLLFLLELIQYEFIICREIIPYREEIISFSRYKHDPEDKAWIARLNYYKDIGVKNKYRHAATINSNKWAVPFDDFAKLYRAIFKKSNTFLKSPLK